MTEERVYVIGTPGSRTVKIGRTVDLKKRLAEIQRMSPVPLEVLWSTPGGHELETQLHRHFRTLRSHGEWFTFPGAPVPTIQDGVASHLVTGSTVGSPHKPDPVSLANMLASLRDASGEFESTRSELHEVIASARAAELSLTEIAEHSPYSREWVRRIAKEAA